MLAALCLTACSKSSKDSVSADAPRAGHAGVSDRDASIADGGGESDAAASAGDSGAGAHADAQDAGHAIDGGSDASASADELPTDCDGKDVPPRGLGPVAPFAVGPAAGGLPEYWPTDGWKSETADKLGIDTAKLMAAADFSTAHSDTQAMLIIRHGYVALEKYATGFSATTRHESYSVAKSFTSGIVGIAMAEGKIASLDDKICKSYTDQWDCDDTSDPRSRITIRHAMNLMTGLLWTENWRSNATGVNDAYNLNLLDTVLARESAEEPGKTKRYSTGDPSLLSGVLQQATGETALAYAKAKIFDVIGTPDIKWNSDSRGRNTTYAGMQATAQEFAKYGYLYLRRGEWDGKQVIPAEYIDMTTQAKGLCDTWNQYLWHVNMTYRLGPQPDSCDGIFCAPTALADLPHDGYFAEGVYGQFIFIVPSADLVVVRLANDDPGSEYWDEYARGFLLAVLDAVN